MAYKVRFSDGAEKTFPDLDSRNAYEKEHGVWAKATTEVDDETPIRIARKDVDEADKKLRIAVLMALDTNQPIFIKKSGSMKRNGGILGDSQLGAGTILSWFEVKDSKGKGTGEFTKKVKIPDSDQEVTLTDAQVKELTGFKRPGRADFGAGV